MGDLVHTLSAIEEAAKHLPGLCIDWVCEEAFVDVPHLSAAVSRVIPVAMRRWRSALLSRATYREVGAFVQNLRRDRYDCVIDAQGLIKTAWITALARCPTGHKWGFDRASIREPLAGVALSHRVHAPMKLHAIERLRMLLAAALGYAVSGAPAVLHAPRMDASAARLPMLDAAIGQGRYVIFFHGTSRAIKAWPLHQWQKLAAAIAAQGWHVVLPWGSHQERDIAHSIGKNLGAMAWVPPKLSVNDIAVMLKHCDAVVGVDSGLTHLASVLAKPTVAVMPAGLDPRYAATKFAPPWTSHVRTVLPKSAASAIDAADVSQALLSIAHPA